MFQKSKAYSDILLFTLKKVGTREIVKIKVNLILKKMKGMECVQCATFALVILCAGM